ncbi:MAG: hypothetical protein HY689_05815 [Chloroflexi bacterium]|nr:hypothetical protein [Chloroflexota bacterium]
MGDDVQVQRTRPHDHPIQATRQKSAPIGSVLQLVVDVAQVSQATKRPFQVDGRGCGRRNLIVNRRQLAIQASKFILQAHPSFGELPFADQAILGKLHECIEPCSHVLNRSGKSGGYNP